MSRVPSLSLIILAATLGAADDAIQVADLRFSLGSAVLPNHADGYFTSVQTPSPPGIAVGAPYEERYGSATGMAGAATATFGTLAPLGLLWGCGLRYANGTLPWQARVMPATTGFPNAGILDAPALAAGGQKAPAMNYSATSAVIELGGGWACSERWHVEAMATGSVDWVNMDSLALSPSIGRQTGKGIGFTYGARLGAYWTSEEQWQFGFGAAWNRSRAMIDTSFADVTTHTDLAGIGFSGYGSVGYRF